MTVEKFHDLLKTCDRYESAPLAAGVKPWSKSSFTAWRYYASLFNCVVRAARAARRDAFTPAEWARIVFVPWLLAERMGCKITCAGFNEVCKIDGPVVFAANHMSTLETFILPGILVAHTPISIVLKESLLRTPLVGVPIAYTRPIAVGRKNPREDLAKVLHDGCARLQDGRSILIFPEATRRAIFDPASFNSLGDKLARKAGVPLVPVALKTDFMGNGRLFKDFGPINPARSIHFAFGTPMGEEQSRGERHKKCVEFIEKQLRAWGAPVCANSEGGENDS